MSAREDAIKGLARVADDWGWKGGKPGEITGTEYVTALERAYKQADKVRTDLELRGVGDLYDGEDQIANAYYGEFFRNIGDLNERALSQFKSSKNPYFRSIDDSTGMGTEIEAAMADFARLEKAGVPREWTARVKEAMDKFYIHNQDGYQPDYLSFAVAQIVSDLMRPMTNDQRQTFLNLLPKWNSGLNQAASAAKKLYRR